mmetsp:Transcript_41247/g.110217  ORF Transcript_41247/g.110217 Transcript_41247/m.110217 type:complete len:340 (-) Transcript_41247:111-1130(-)
MEPHLDVHGVDGHAHGVHAEIHVQDGARDRRVHVRAERQGGSADIIGLELAAGKRRVGSVELDGAIDEARLAILGLLDGVGSAGLGRTGGNAVDADAPLATRLPGKNASVGLECSLGRGHATTIARNAFLRGNVADRDGRASRSHKGPELLDHGDQRIGRRGRGAEVSLAADFKQGLLNLGTVGEGVNEIVDLAIILLDLLRNRLDIVSTQTNIMLMLLDRLRNLFHGGVQTIERIDLVDLQRAAILKNGVFTKTLVNHVQELLVHGWPGSNNHGRARASKCLDNAPPETLGISHTCNKAHLPCDKIDTIPRVNEQPSRSPPCPSNQSCSSWRGHHCAR